MPRGRSTADRVLLPPAGRPLLAGLALVGLAQAAAAVALAVLIDRAFSAAAEDGRVTPGAAGAVALLVAAVTLLRYRERVDGERLGQAVAHHVRQRLTEHLVKLPPTLGAGPAGDVLLRFTGDLAALRNWYARGVVTLVVTLPMVLAGLAAIAWLDWRIGAAIAAALGLATGAQVALAPGLRRAGREARRRRGRLASDVIERVDALASVQLHGRAPAEARRLDRRSDALAEAMVERARWSGMLRATAEWLAAGLPFLMLGVWSLAGGLDFGVAASTLSLGALLGPRVRELGRLTEYRTLARISRERIDAFLRREALDLRPDARKARRRSGALKLRGLGVEGVFSDLSLAAEAGARVALVGPNGAGKSRLLGVIAGLEPPSRGRVVIDRQDMGRRRLASIHRLVALAGAGTPLMRGTVDANIRYGARADEPTAREILDLAGYDALVAELPEGGATRIGPGGRGLSLGQQRRVILMRALMRRPVVLLLDEIESGLDEAGQALLARVFDEFEGSIVMATHDEGWRRRCDAVWTLPGRALPSPGPAAEASHG